MPAEKNNLFQRIFIFFIRYTSYTFSVILFSGLASSAIAITFIIFFARETGLIFDEVVIYVINGLLFSAYVIQAVYWGIFNRLGIKAFNKAARQINYINDIDPGSGLMSVRTSQRPEDYRRVLVNINKMPWKLTTHSIIWASTMFISYLVTVFQRNLGSELETPELIKSLILALIASAIAVLIMGIFSYIIGEIVTGPQRVALKTHMDRQKVSYKELAMFSVKGKFTLLLILIVAGVYSSNMLTFSLSSRISEQLILGEMMDKMEDSQSKTGKEALRQSTRALFAFSRLPFDKKVIHLWPVLRFNLFIIILFLFMAYLVFYTLNRSIRQIQHAQTDLKAGGDGALHPVSLDRELVSLGDNINQTNRTVREYQQNLEEKVANRTRELSKALEKLRDKDDIIRNELEIARDIQAGILPDNFPQWNGIRFAYRFLPMENVSGDYIDVFASDNRLSVLVADVSGHGIPAALITTMAKVTFQQAVEQKATPAEVLASVNRTITSHVKTPDFLTAFLLSIDATHNVTYSSASHPHAIVWRHETNTVELIDTNGLLIGALEEASSSYENGKTALTPGDRIFLYTDGIIERKNALGEIFGYDRLQETVTTYPRHSIEEMANQILIEIEKFSGFANPSDDVSILILELDKDYRQKEDLWKQISHAEKKDRKALRGLLDELAALDPADETMLLARARLESSEGSYEEAKSLLMKIIHKNAENARANFQLGYVYFQQNRLDEAYTYTRTAVELAPSYQEALHNLAAISLKLGKTTLAIRHLEHALTIDPENTELEKKLNRLRQEPK